MRINKRIFSSLRWKIAVAYLIVTGVGFFVIDASIMQILEKDYIDEKSKSFQLYALQTAQTIANSYYDKDPDIYYEIRGLGEEYSRIEGESTRILVLNRNGVVEYDSFQSVSLLRRDLKSDYPEIVSVLKGDFVPARDLYIYTGNPPERKRVMYSYAPIIHHSDGIIGMVLISTSLENIDALLGEISRLYRIYSAAISLAVILISIAISGLITQPIKELTDSITKMSQGHLNQRIKIHGSHELRQLGTAFNIMSEKLENLDNARNEFVSNASHELKTPLSAMKVLIESLLHMDMDDPGIYKEFLADINFEIDRLNAIITDLLTLVQLDKNVGSTLQKMESVELTELTRRTVRNLQLLAEQKRITMELYSDEDVVVEGDGVKLQQVISNLVDNAIKYTPEGGRVTISISKSPEFAIVKISDTGIGIPAEYLSKIFDRFFRVDKARSRSTGGTGLGLSIANRIVLMHGGYIRVTSEEGKGSTFQVELPYKQ
ncbi:MAG TPA: HAMP domain-containing sensor histidine kinase [Candidatus Atribacteria bacterium]|nr:HAMP domain-containing sensor histidine kinase [Candidatus Atribacteria bacterium]HPT77675.1 HAMP domain-containing sensor histidine kinase [Candidatus Atribacteria bacterium]